MRVHKIEIKQIKKSSQLTALFLVTYTYEIVF